MKNPSILSAPNVYTTIAVLYTIRNYIPIPSFFSKAIFVLFFLLSVYYLFRAITECWGYPFVKVLSLLFILSGLYGLFLVLSPPDYTWLRQCAPSQFINDFFDSLLPIFAYIFFSKKGLINNNWLLVWSFVFMLAAGIKYVGMQEESMRAILNGDEDMRRNAGYTIMAMIPCIPFFKKYNVLKYILWVIILMAIIFSAKRGAVLLSGLAFLAFLWTEVRVNNHNRKIGIFVLAGVALFVLTNYFQNLLESFEVFSDRFAAPFENDFSDRETIFSDYIQFFLNEQSVITLMFGHGAYATLHYLGLMAHNDWLELAIDMGLLGVGVYLLYWIKVMKIVAKSRVRCPAEVYISLLLFAILFFGKSFFSMSILSIPIFASAPFGYCIGQYYNNLQSR